MNRAWPCPAGCYTHLLTRASEEVWIATSTFPFGLTDSFQFIRSTGERRVTWGGGWARAAGFSTMLELRVKTKPDFDQILKSKSSCVFSPV